MKEIDTVIITGAGRPRRGDAGYGRARTPDPHCPHRWRAV